MTPNSPEPAPSSFAAYRAAVNGAAGVVTAVGLIGLWGSTYIPDGAVKKAVESLAAAVLAIGVLQVLSEAYLQRRLSGEVFGELGAIEQRLAEQIVRPTIELARDLGRSRGRSLLDSTPGQIESSAWSKWIAA